MAARITRSRFLLSAGGALFTLALARGSALASGQHPLAALALTARNTGRRYAGDRSLFATVSPGVPGRDTAAVRFTLNRAATVKLEAVRTAKRLTSVAWETEARLRPGQHELRWTPDAAAAVGSYVMRLTIDRRRCEADGPRRAAPASVARQQAPVVRVLGVEAAFLRRSYAPGRADGASHPRGRSRADAAVPAPRRREPTSSERNDELSGAPRGRARADRLDREAVGPVTITVQTGAWPIGVYAARLTTRRRPRSASPRSSCARRHPARSGSSSCCRPTPGRPTTCTTATATAGATRGTREGTHPSSSTAPTATGACRRASRRTTGRSSAGCRAPGRTPDMVADDDLEAFASGDELRALYDLVVFPGHSEYMTGHAYDVVERYRDLGGRLIFLSANNFFWRVDKQGSTMRRVRLWRDEGRPEARLLGVQYRANDDGARQGPLHGRRGRGGAVAVRQDGPRDRVDVRRDGRRLRDRDRHRRRRTPLRERRAGPRSSTSSGPG